MPYCGTLKELNLSTLSTRRLRGDLITVYRYLHGKNILGTKGLFNLVKKSIKRANGWTPDKFKCEIRRIF